MQAKCMHKMYMYNIYIYICYILNCVIWFVLYTYFYKNTYSYDIRMSMIC